MKRWLVVVTCSLLSACTTYHPPAGVSLARQYQDEVECKAQAELGAGAPGLLFRETIRGELLGKCLISRGWSKEGAQ
jgi:hypothetical protein